MTSGMFPAGRAEHDDGEPGGHDENSRQNGKVAVSPHLLLTRFELGPQRTGRRLSGIRARLG